jgi:predicted outer membrane protein
MRDPSRWPFRRGELLVIAAFVVVGSLAIFVTLPGSAASGLNTVATRFGPLQASDRDLVVKVRLAGLWEIPAGQWAQQRAGSNRVKEVGRHLVEDHTKLDKEVRALAEKLGVALPNEPNDDQKEWLNQMSQVTGEQFDVAFADLLRAAHGKVFTTIAQVRAGTKNDEIRAFAQKANAVVLRHMTLLESTGKVNYTDLPDAPNPK